MNPPPEAVELRNAAIRAAKAKAFNPFRAAVATLSETERELIEGHAVPRWGVLELNLVGFKPIYGFLVFTDTEYSFLRWRVSKWFFFGRSYGTLGEALLAAS